MIEEIAGLINNTFASDQSYHLKQMPDGKYKKVAGVLTPALVEASLRSGGSIGSYQKNMDLTINWICFDFDILKKNLDGDVRELAQKELEKTVKKFCLALDALEIPYLIEFSGNRGFHVWITFSDKIQYRTGYEIRQALMDKIQLSFNDILIAIDYFPASGAISDSVGKGVKLPLSRHTKTGEYSFLLKSNSEIGEINKFGDLADSLIRSNIETLITHKNISKAELERKLDAVFEFHDDTLECARIKSIKVTRKGFTLADLAVHWKDHPPLASISRKIFETGDVSHEERKLLVGIFCNVYMASSESFGIEILHELFRKTKNYNHSITDRSIKKLASLNFPTQEQIEHATQQKFSDILTVERLLKSCIPNVSEYSDGTFEISKIDIEIVRRAELNYLFMNDEVQSKMIINELSSSDCVGLLRKVKDLMLNPGSSEFYTHQRREKNKTRTLISLKATERLTTSFILKQLFYFFDIQPSGNSHGYKPNKGFKGGYIFQQWLYLWIKFVSNISEAIKDEENQNFYIVKTDIKSFYDTIPHDNLKRLLLGDGVSKIAEKIRTLSSDSVGAYNNHIDTIFKITEKVVGDKIGLPQGPAYARYFAEIYLDGLDRKFDEKVQSGTLTLYQRYVDDIFFIASSEEHAIKELKTLRNELNLLGLKINDEKTIVTKIENFSDDFDRYRAQSKYAVDKSSRNFAEATQTQKNLAIGEFIQLVESDACDQDLAFIFSHLDGVEQVEPFKRSKIEPVLHGRMGRGSLYKHLFNFILESQENWDELNKVESFDPLQSEVLTSCLIFILESNTQMRDELKNLIIGIYGKLHRSDLVEENIAYLIIVYGLAIDASEISPMRYITCLKSLPNSESVKDLEVTPQLIDYLNTSLNNIKKIKDFIEVIYPLCASSKIRKKELNQLSRIFYAKMSSDEISNQFHSFSSPQINTPSSASKFYYLLCLLSISNKNKSTDLLKSIWKYCVYVFNECDMDTSYGESDWFRKVSEVECDEENALFIISTIVDGSIVRGIEDKCKIFERFHNLFLIFISFQGSNIDHRKLDQELNKLRDKAEFYKWITDAEKPRLFPTTTDTGWFERNLIENSMIMLKRERHVLIRRPTGQFHRSSAPKNELNGYSEIVIDYDACNLCSISDVLANKNFVQRLSILVDVVASYDDKDKYPNIFSSERMLKKTALVPFSEELEDSKTLIFESEAGNIECLENNKDNFIKIFAKIASKGSRCFAHVKERYLDNLEPAISTSKFIKNLNVYLKEIGDLEDDFYIDVCSAASAYTELDEVDLTKKIDRFVNQYHKFNKGELNRHIYAVDSKTDLSDETFLNFFGVITASLEIVPNKIAPSIPLYLKNDIDNYREKLIKLLDSLGLNADDLIRVHPMVMLPAETLKVEGKEYHCKNISILNVTENLVAGLDIRNMNAIRASEHVYVKDVESHLYVIAIHSSISIIFRSIKNRHDNFKTCESYPAAKYCKEEVFSLNKFNIAAEVISKHRNIPKTQAETLLVDWISGLPKSFRQPSVNLIAAHVSMHEEDIENFIDMVNRLLDQDGSNPFLLKRMEDHNGTHRVLYKNPEIGRKLEQLSPLAIKSGSKIATIVVDNIISGKQVAKAIAYYSGKREPSSGSNYFVFDEDQKNRLAAKLFELEKINICTISYTNIGLEKIKQAYSKWIGKSIEVKVICGVGIDQDAFFESTSRIGELDKAEIRRLLSSAEEVEGLSNLLGGAKLGPLSVADINKTNLVARFLSMPKLHFKYLTKGLIRNDDCRPFVRVSELNDLPD